MVKLMTVMFLSIASLNTAHAWCFHVPLVETMRLRCTPGFEGSTVQTLHLSVRKQVACDSDPMYSVEYLSPSMHYLPGDRLSGEEEVGPGWPQDIYGWIFSGTASLLTKNEQHHLDRLVGMVRGAFFEQYIEIEEDLVSGKSRRGFLVEANSPMAENFWKCERD